MKSLLAVTVLLSSASSFAVVPSTTPSTENYRCFWKNSETSETFEMGRIQINKDADGVEKADLIDWGSSERTNQISISHLGVKRVDKQIMVDYGHTDFKNLNLILTQTESPKKFKYDLGLPSPDRADFCKKLKK